MRCEGSHLNNCDRLDLFVDIFFFLLENVFSQ